MTSLIQEFIQATDILASQFVGFLLSLVAAIIFYIFRLRPRLVFGRPHSSRHVLNLSNPKESEPENLLEIYNEQFFVANEGRRAARNVDIVLNDFPRNISIYPPCDWTCKNVEKGNCQITIPYIAPKELFQIDCIYLNQKAAFIVTVRSEDGLGKAVNLWTVRRFPDWVNLILFALFFLGVAFVLQVIFQLVNLGDLFRGAI